MEIQNSSSPLSESNQLKNVNTERLDYESRNITQSGEIDDKKSEVIELVVNVGMNIISKNFYIEIEKRSFFV